MSFSLNRSRPCYPDQSSFMVASEGAFRLQKDQVIAFRGASIGNNPDETFHVVSVTENKVGLAVECVLRGSSGQSYDYVPNNGWYAKQDPLSRNCPYSHLPHNHTVVLIRAAPLEETPASEIGNISCKHLKHLPLFEYLLHLVSKEFPDNGFVQFSIDLIEEIFSRLMRLGAPLVAELVEEAKKQPEQQKNIVAQAYDRLLSLKAAVESTKTARTAIDHKTINLFVAHVEKFAEKFAYKRQKKEIEAAFFQHYSQDCTSIVVADVVAELVSSYIGLKNSDSKEDQGNCLEDITSTIKTLSLEEHTQESARNSALLHTLNEYMSGKTAAIIVPESFQSALAQITSLQTLEWALDSQEMRSRFCNVLRFLIEHCPNLQQLDLEHVSNLHDSELLLVGQLHALKRLSLQECDALTDEGLSALQGLICLESLDLSHCSFTGAGFHAFQSMQRLQTLDTIGCRNLDRTVVLPHLKLLKGLRTLYMGGNFRKNHAIRYKAEMPWIDTIIGTTSRQSDLSTDDSGDD